MRSVNERIRERARREVAKRTLSQDEVARLAGIKQATVSRLLTGKLGKPGAWEKLLDALGLELVAVPKGTDLSEAEEKETDGKTSTR